MATPEGAAPAASGRVGASVRRNWELLSSTGGLLSANLVISATGFAFWAVASRRFPAESVGEAAALFSLVLFLTWLTALGLPLGVARFSVDRSRTAGVVYSWACVLTTLSSLVGAIGLMLVRPASLEPLLDVFAPVVVVALLTAMVSGLSISNMLNFRLTAVRRRRVVVATALIAGIIRIPALSAEPLDVTVWIWLAVVGTLAARGLLGTLAFHRAVGPLRLAPVPPAWPMMLEYTMVNSVSLLVGEAPFIVVPVVVLASVSAATNAAFFVAWSAAAIVFVVIRVLGNALLIEGRREGPGLVDQTRFTLAVSAAFAVAATIVSLLGAVLLRAIFGPAYAEGAAMLPGLVAGSVLYAMTAPILSEARVRHDRSLVLTVPFVLALVVIAIAIAVVPSLGLGGVVLAWLTGHGAAASTALLMRSRSVRSGAVAPLLRPGEARNLGSLLVAAPVLALAGLLAGIGGVVAAGGSLLVIRRWGPRPVLAMVLVLVTVAAVGTIVEGGDNLNSYARQRPVATAAGRFAAVLLLAALAALWRAAASSSDPHQP